MEYTIEYEPGEKEAHLSKATVYLNMKDTLRSIEYLQRDIKDPYALKYLEESHRNLTVALEELEKFHPRPRRNF